jgi:hypothetical protein
MQVRSVIGALAVALLTACQPALKAEQFAGSWTSSRLATPIHLHTSGEWEIRGDEGRALQLGVWQLQDRSIHWTVRLGDGRLMHEINPVVSWTGQRFQLRERDGSVTTFERRH